MAIRNDAAAIAHAPSWYAATAGSGPDATPLAGEATADVCIIGGGYTGLSAALHLASAGVRVVLLERALLGWGASGRNGGQVHVGMRRDQRWLERRLGDAAAADLWRIALDAREHLRQLIEERGIECDFRPGYIHADHKPGYVADSRAAVEHMHARYGYDALRFIDRDEVRARVASADYHGGIVDPNGGHLHALKLAHGIAAAAIAAGAVVHPLSPATSVRRDNGRWRVDTPGGAVRAEKVLVACNGYLDGLVPPVEARVMPINNFVAVTEPLDPERARALIPGGEAVSDSRFVVYYFRVTPDRRLLFGGGESYGYAFPRDIPAVVRRHMLRVFPQLANVPLAHGWGGTLAITPNRLPYVREVEPGLVAIGGYSGLGVVLAPYFGKLIADLLARGRSDDMTRLMRLPVPRFPGGRWLRLPTLIAAMSFLALRDRL